MYGFRNVLCGMTRGSYFLGVGLFLLGAMITTSVEPAVAMAEPGAGPDPVFVPVPQEVELTGNDFPVSSELSIVTVGLATDKATGEDVLQREIARLYGFTPPIVELRADGTARGKENRSRAAFDAYADTTILLGEASCIRKDAGPGVSRLVAALERVPSSREGYLLEVSPEGVLVLGRGAPGVFYGAQTLIQLLRWSQANDVELPGITVRDWPSHPIRAMHLLSIHPSIQIHSQHAELADIKRSIATMAHLKMNTLLWEVNCGVVYDATPELALSWSETKEKAREVIAFAGAHHIEAIPSINLSTGHDDWMGPYSLVVDTQTYLDAVRNITGELMDLFGNPRFFCAGLDEGERGPADYLRLIEFLREVLDPQRCRLLIWADRYWTGIDWTPAPERLPDETIDAWAEKHLKEPWRKALEELPDDVVLLNWRYASSTFPFAEYLDHKGCLQIGSTWNPGGTLGERPFAPWIKGFAVAGARMQSPRFLGMTGTAWHAGDRNHVQRNIVYSADAFWNPSAAPHSEEDIRAFGRVDDVQFPYGAADEERRGYRAALPTGPPFPSSTAPASPGLSKRAFSRALRVLRKKEDPDRRIRAFIDIGKATRPLPVEEVVALAQNRAEQLLAFWAIGRSDLECPAGREALERLVVSDDWFVRWRARDLIAKRGFDSSVPREDITFYRALTVPATITTSFTPPPEYSPSNLVDGNGSTYFWGCRAAEAGDYIALDFGCPRRVGRIAIDDSRYAADYAADLFRETFRGRLNASDYIHYGRLEYSLDGKEWVVLGETRLKMPIDFSMPPTSVRFLRLVVTEPQVHWPAVFSLEVEVENTGIAETESR